MNDIKRDGFGSDGQTMVELVAVMGLAVIMVAVIVIVVVGSLKTNQTARNRAKATRLVEEEIAWLEVVRNRMSRDQFTLDAANPLWCDNPEECYIDEASWSRQVGGYQTVTVDGVDFERGYTTPDPNIECDDVVNNLGVRIEVRWQESGGQRQVVNWRCLGPPVTYR
jgi:hypothetical protein